MVPKASSTAVRVITAKAVGEFSCTEVGSPEHTVGRVFTILKIGPGLTIITTVLLIGSEQPFAAMSKV